MGSRKKKNDRNYVQSSQAEITFHQTVNLNQPSLVTEILCHLLLQLSTLQRKSKQILCPLKTIVTLQTELMLQQQTLIWRKWWRMVTQMAQIKPKTMQNNQAVQAAQTQVLQAVKMKHRWKKHRQKTLNSFVPLQHVVRSFNLLLHYKLMKESTVWNVGKMAGYLVIIHDVAKIMDLNVHCSITRKMFMITLAKDFIVLTACLRERTVRNHILHNNSWNSMWEEYMVQDLFRIVVRALCGLWTDITTRRNARNANVYWTSIIL